MHEVAGCPIRGDRGFTGLAPPPTSGVRLSPGPWASPNPLTIVYIGDRLI